KDNPEKVYPYAGISVKLGSKGTVYGRFRPGLELIRMRDLVRSHPFSDFSALRLQDHSSRWEAGFSLNVFPQFALDVLGRFSKVSDYPAPVFPSATVSILSSGSPVYYPGWLFVTLEEVKLNEITGKIDWAFIPSLRLFGWITFLHSDIRKNGQYSAGIRSNDVPYIPDISAYGKISWNFYREHEIALYSRYAGNRFDDIQNSIELPAYFLLNAKLDLKFGEYVIIFLTGENLLDKKYDIWKGFSAPGLTGYAGIRLVL
ncbi:MAG: TonB-dependent receptor, partial [Calditrichaeota bacterium]|nr:TonB-dependent receptor [Calditrichota bacterium]